MPKRPCLEPGCPTLTSSSRCPEHTRQQDQRRGTPAQRGYDADHRAQRRMWQARIDAGQNVWCWRCGARIVGRDWHLGHDDTDRSITRGPECVRCNLSAAGRAAHGLPPMTGGDRDPLPPSPSVRALAAESVPSTQLTDPDER